MKVGKKKNEEEGEMPTGVQRKTTVKVRKRGEKVPLEGHVGDL